MLRTVGHLGRLMRVGYAFAREGVLGLVDTEALPATSRAFTAVVPDYEDSWRRGEDDWNKRLEKEAALSDQRIAIMAALVASAVFGSEPGKPLLARRAAQNEAARKTTPSTNDDDNAALLVQRGELARVQTAADIAQLPLKFAGGATPLLVQDVAEVRLGTKFRTGAATLFDSETVIGSARMLAG